MYETTYHRPSSVDEAVALFGKGSDSKYLAGGHTLIPVMKQRLASPSDVIDLGKIKELVGIELSADALTIKAATTYFDILESADAKKAIPAIVHLTSVLGDPQVRYRGTIGGDISHGDPGNDHPAVMLCLGASFVLKGGGGERVVPADGYFLGTYTTAIEPDEIMTEIRIPVPAKDSGSCYAKLKRKTGDFATAATAVLLKLDGDVVLDVSIALTNVGATALKATDAENSLRRRPLTESAIVEAARLAMSICDPVEDLRGSVEYKRAMAGEMTLRALRTAAGRAKR